MNRGGASPNRRELRIVEDVVAQTALSVTSVFYPPESWRELVAQYVDSKSESCQITISRGPNMSDERIAEEVAAAMRHPVVLAACPMDDRSWSV
jgi:hypothetical protein